MFLTHEPYIPIGRELLLVDELGTDEKIATYTRDIYTKAFTSSTVSEKTPLPPLPPGATYISEDTRNGVNPVTAESFMVPRFVIRTQPMISRKDADECEYDILPRMENCSIEALDRQEDAEIMMALNTAVPCSQSISLTGVLQPENIITAIGLITSHELTARSIVVHPRRYWEMKAWGHNKFKEVDTGLTAKHKATFHDINVYSCTMCPINVVYVLASPEFLGALVVFESDTKSEIKDNEKCGYASSRTIGICVANDFAAARIVTQ